MNEYFSGGPRAGGFDAMYYWNQFHPILAAIAILLIGWVVALIVAAASKKVLEKLGTNQKLSNTTGHRSNIESIVSRIVFLDCDGDCCYWRVKCAESHQCEWTI